MKKLLQIFFFPGLLLMVLIANLFVDQTRLYENKQIHSRNRNYAGVLAEKQNMDMLILGDSEGYSSISPLQLWHAHGIASFNCSMTGQNIVETYSELADALKKHDVRLVLLETNLLFRFSDNMKTAQLVLAEQLYRAMPVLRYHSSWKTIFFTEKENRGEANWPKGYHIADKIGFQEAVEREEDESTEVKIPDWNLHCLDKIRKLCSEHGAVLVFYSSPSPKNYSRDRITYLQDFCEKEQIPYVNLLDHMEEMGLDIRLESYDGGDHLNISGAAKATKFMGKYLAEHYDLPDRREEPAYAEWNTESSAYRKRIRKLLRKMKNNAARTDQPAGAEEENAGGSD